jgi:hypothetical protein
VKKKLTLLMATITVFLILAPTMSVEASSPANMSSSADVDITTFSIPSIMSVEWEETEWVFATKDGYYWKRLWSLTYGEWLSDWIRLAPVGNGGNV